MTNRDAQRRAFLDSSDWAAAEVKNLAGDASNRRYFRLSQDDGTTAVLMDAPPEKGEDIRPFVDIARHLKGMGLGAPALLQYNTDHGFMLLEDLGDDLFARVLEKEPRKEQELYEAACDVLLHLHKAPLPDDLPPYDPKTMADLSALTHDWYIPGITGKTDAATRDRFAAMLEGLFTGIDQVTEVLIQRDYHAENLLWLPGRDGLLKVGLLDFQDAAAGHRAYDLVSLLQDARRDVSEATQAHILNRYIERSGQTDEAFRRAYHLLGVQRNLRILGVFARLCIRDGKPHYVDLIPRVWGHLEHDVKSLNSSELDSVLADLPTPTPYVLKKLKDKCKSPTLS